MDNRSFISRLKHLDTADHGGHQALFTEKFGCFALESLLGSYRYFIFADAGPDFVHVYTVNLEHTRALL